MKNILEWLLRSRLSGGIFLKILVTLRRLVGRDNRGRGEGHGAAQ